MNAIPGIATYPFPKEKAAPSFQFTINDIRDGSAYYKAPPHSHTHTYFEIFVIEKGGGHHKIDGDEYGFADCSVHILQPGTPHVVRRSASTRGWVIVFALDVIAGNANPITDSLIGFFKNRLMQPVAVLPARVFKELKSIVHLMLSSGHVAGQAREKDEFVRSLFSAFLLTLKPHFTTSYSLQDAEKLGLVRKFEDMVNEHYHEGYPLGAYAAKLGVGEKTLSRAVKLHTGQTPALVIRKRILLEACRLLQSEVYSIKEIAYHLHFSDPAHFVRTFRQEKGCTPLEYRKRKGE